MVKFGRKKFKWVNREPKYKNVFKKASVPITILVLFVAILLMSNSLTKNAASSIYNINDLETNFDNIQIGDSVNYEINGYSD